MPQHEDEQQWHLPAALRITNPKVAQDAADLRKQLESRAVSPFARLSPLEFAKNRARARIEHLSVALLQVEAELSRTRGRASHQKLLEARDALSIRLAENLSVVGQYKLAAEVDPRPEYKKEYAKRF